MVITKKNRYFYSLLVVSLLAALILILPQFPQEGLRERLTSMFAQALHQPCRIEKVTLQILPQPAVILHNFTTSQSESVFEARTLELDLSLLSLVTLTPKVVGVRLNGALIKAPLDFFRSSKTDSSDSAVAGSFLSPMNFFSRNFWSQDLHLKYLRVQDSVCELIGIPGQHNPLAITDLAGSWRFSQNSSERLELTGVCGGGQGDLKVTWYRVTGENVDGSDNLFDRAGDRVEISCNLDDISLSGYEMVLPASADRILRGGFTQADIEFDINGDPEGGLRFSGHFTAADHSASIYEVNSEVEKTYSQGELKVSLTGFLQRHDGYVNIKNAALEYPGAATLFYRGLLRFNEPMFVDLVSELKVTDVGLLTHSLPFLSLAGYQAEGQLAGQLKLVGNPKSSPVLQINLESEKIVLRPEDLSGATSEESPVEIEKSATGNETESDDRQASGFKVRFGEWLRQVAKWEWRLKSDCRIAELELPGMTVNDLSLLAEKSLVQVEIERLAARFGKSGQLRLSLILENLLHDPTWQASLIAEKLDLKPFHKTLSWSGILDASLVGGGMLKSGPEPVTDLDLNGKWSLRQGTFTGCPLFKEFSNFLERSGKKRLGSGFSKFSGKFSLRNNILRLKNLKLLAAGNRVNGGGSFSTTDNQLKFYGQYIPKTSSPFSFSLLGNCKKPHFRISHR